jgi:hypothetical protein
VFVPDLAMAETCEELLEWAGPDGRVLLHEIYWFHDALSAAVSPRSSVLSEPGTPREDGRPWIFFRRWGGIDALDVLNFCKNPSHQNLSPVAAILKDNALRYEYTEAQIQVAFRRANQLGTKPGIQLFLTTKFLRQSKAPAVPFVEPPGDERCVYGKGSMSEVIERELPPTNPPPQRLDVSRAHCDNYGPRNDSRKQIDLEHVLAWVQTALDLADSENPGAARSLRDHLQWFGGLKEYLQSFCSNAKASDIHVDVQDEGTG